MRLTVGITENAPQWEILLGQIGVPTETVNLYNTLKTDNYAVIIVSKNIPQHGKENLLQFLLEGGTILIEANVAKSLFDIKTSPAYVKYVDPDEDPIFDGVVAGSIDGKLKLPTKATILKSDSGRKLVQIHKHGKGVSLILPGAFSGSILDTKVRRRNFATRGPLLPSERVSRRSKQTIRTIVQRSLEYLYDYRQLPFVYLWPFPDGVQTIFNFRIDTDFATEKEISSLFELCHRHSIPATWFVETASAEEWMSHFTKMENQEIGLHCFRHRVNSKFIECENEIRHGINILNRSKIQPNGYAAPFGEWNVPLAKAIEHHGFTYSSEFTLGYNDLPFYPYLGDRFSAVLQIPIHPITTSCLRNAHHDSDDMENYFQDVIEEHTTRHIPIFIYDHPSNANHNTLNWLFEQINELKIPTMNLIEFALWWKKRQASEFEVSFKSGKLLFNQITQDTSIWLGIRRDRREWTTVEIKNDLELDSLQWNQDRKPKARTPMAILASLNRKMIVNNLLHTYWKYKL